MLWYPGGLRAPMSHRLLRSLIVSHMPIEKPECEVTVAHVDNYERPSSSNVFSLQGTILSVFSFTYRWPRNVSCLCVIG